MPAPGECCLICVHPYPGHDESCPHGQVLRLRARVAELEAERDRPRLSAGLDDPDGTPTVLRYVKDWAAGPAPTPDPAGLHREDARRERARVDELLWIESTSCCGDESRQYGVRARAAEAQVAAVLTLAGQLDQEAGAMATSPDIVIAAQGLGRGDAASRIREALDAASTPASGHTDTTERSGNHDRPEPAAADTRPHAGRGAHPGPQHHQQHPERRHDDDHADDLQALVDAASTPESATHRPTVQVGTATTGANQPAEPAVTDAMVQAAINAALERSGHLDQHIVCDWCHLNSPYPRYAGPAQQRVFRAALEAALGTPATEPHTSLTEPHSGQDCPDRIEVTGWGMTDREWICGCDPRPDATAPAETTSPSEAP